MTSVAGGVLKRAFDIVGAGGLLVATAPLQLAAALAVKLEDGGPVLFRQERVGRHGMTFRIHKFRSMHIDHEGRPISPSGDPRVTRIGTVLRSTKLDELPQLLDVLGGAMSLVGPRPEVPSYVALWPAEERDVILSVRPGITDPASVALRDEGQILAGVEDPESHYIDVLLPQKVAVYVDYVRRRSFAGDLLILLRTAKALFRRPG